MKFKLIVLFILFIICCAPVFAAAPLDSIGVENINGKKVIIHKLDPKDNYFSIGRRYNIKPNVIIQYNHNAALKIGETIKVPTEIPFDQPAVAETPAAPQPQKPATAAPTVKPTQTVQPEQPAKQPPVTVTNNIPETQSYKVSAGETLYAIARRFNTTVEDIKKTNKLTSNYLAPGRILKVHANTPDEPEDEDDPIIVDGDSVGSDSADGVHPNKFGLYEKTERGVATWLDGEGFDSSKKLALHATAPIGTVIKITNSMTHRTTFAKVVGRFTENEDTKGVVIVMTKNVAESLGALDKRFHVTLSYGTTNE